MKKSFKHIVLIAILVLTFVVAAIPVAAAEPTPGQVSAWVAEEDFGAPPSWSMASLPSRCGSSC